jgi:hypothetical protein
MFNPYTYHGSNLENSARHVFAITPTDATDLESVCKSIRIANKDAANPAFVRYVTDKGDDVTVWVPANSVWTEPAVITQVWATGTTAGLEIHGYSD